MCHISDVGHRQQHRVIQLTLDGEVIVLGHRYSELRTEGVDGQRFQGRKVDWSTRRRSREWERVWRGTRGWSSRVLRAPSVVGSRQAGAPADAPDPERGY